MASKLKELADTLLKPLRGILHYFRMAYFVRSHALTSSTLKVGTWHDLSDRVLYCLFDELVNFVETECALMQVLWSEEDARVFEYRRPILGRLMSWRNAAAGIAHLEWAAGLKYEDDGATGPECVGLPTPQAEAAAEILRLYRWWKTERPARPDPRVASGWKYGEETFMVTAARRMLEIEAAQEAEDDEMLVRLIRVRKHLWT